MGSWRRAVVALGVIGAAACSAGTSTTSAPSNTAPSNTAPANTAPATGDTARTATFCARLVDSLKGGEWKALNDLAPDDLKADLRAVGRGDKSVYQIQAKVQDRCGIDLAAALGLPGSSSVPGTRAGTVPNRPPGTSAGTIPTSLAVPTNCTAISGWPERFAFNGRALCPLKVPGLFPTYEWAGYLTDPAHKALSTGEVNSDRSDSTHWTVEQVKLTDRDDAMKICKAAGPSQSRFSADGGRGQAHCSGTTATDLTEGWVWDVPASSGGDSWVVIVISSQTRSGTPGAAYEESSVRELVNAWTVVPT